MINKIWLSLISCGIFVSIFTGNVHKLNEAIFNAASDSVQLSLNLLGPMAIWLGLLKIAKKSGLINSLKGLISPLIKYIFPDIPKDSPAFGAIILNLSANILGLGNSSTPLGIKAVKELQKHNIDKTTASPAMCTLLALNTSSITLIPSAVIALRAAAGSAEPAVITISTLFATTISTITALTVDKTFRTFSTRK